MRYKQLLLAMVASVFLAGSAVAADEYTVDVPHSTIGFAVKHLTISTVRGKFTDFHGMIRFDENDMTKTWVDLTIKATSVDTGNERRDNHLRNPDFFEVEKFPDITFKSKSVEKSGDGFIIIGDFAMHGVTKEIRIPFTFAGKANDRQGKQRVAFDGALTINRQDYGIAYDKTGITVGNDIKIEFSVQAIKVDKE
jgi:polyisoprenoid-binding protein YceI